MQVACHNEALTNLFGITVTAFMNLQPEERDRVLLEKLIDALVLVKISVPNKKTNYPKYTIKQFLHAPAVSATNRSLNFNTSVEPPPTVHTGANANHAKRPTRANIASVAATDTNADADAGLTKT